MDKYNITGMSCAACSARVEKAVSKVEGVSSCSVNLLTNSMNVEGTAPAETIISAVEAAGYGAALSEAKKKPSEKSKELENKEFPVLRNRLIASLVFMVVLMYFSMGAMMWGFPLPYFIEHNYIALGILQLILTVIVMVINQKFFISGFKGLINKAPNMDTLVALGSGASFVYSLYALFAMTDAQLKGNMAGVMSYYHEFYFESAAMILTLITVGKMLESYSKGKTTNAIKALMELAPKTAILLRDNVETEVPVEDVKKGDIFIVRPGMSIPVDGIIIEGSGAIDESALTGESIPVDKAVGNSVYSATINKSGFLKCEATKVGEDTTLSAIIKMVSDAAATKAPISKVADKVSGIFVPTVIAIAIVTTIIWLLVGEDVGFALARGISVLVISCPCALGLATPVAIMVGSGKGARTGILFKTATALEAAGKINTVVLDKTGTITKGEPSVTDIIPYNISEDELLKYAYSLEGGSEHPLANAIIQKGNDLNIKAKAVSSFKAVSGNGLEGIINGVLVKGGNASYIENIPKELVIKSDKLASQGKTPIFFSIDNKPIGIIAVADTIKEDSSEAINDLKNMGIKVVMLTGDNKHTADAIGAEVGVDFVISEVLPDGKEKEAKKLMEDGKVAMVGDGINDAPALTRADVGIAIGAGTDIAIEAADVVLMKNSLCDAVSAIKLGKATLRNIHENLFWAFIYNVIGIPIAAGLFIPITGWQLSPMFGAAAMSFSSFCVVTNALRLNFANIGTKIKNNIIKEEKTMKKTIKIEGMMCGHCEAHVKKALEALPTVTEAVVSHQKGTAVVTLSDETNDDILKKAVEDEGYKVIG